MRVMIMVETDPGIGQKDRNVSRRECCLCAQARRPLGRHVLEILYRK